MKTFTSFARLLSPSALSPISLLIATCSANNAYAKTYGIKTDTHYSIQWDTYASSYSPTQSIESFTDDWDEPLASGNFAFIQGRSDIHYRTDQTALSYGLNYRYDYLLSFDPATAQVYWDYKNKKLPNENHTYPLKLSANHNERLGFGLANEFKLNPNWHITPQFNLWQGLHAVTGDFKGNLTTKASYPKSSKLVDSVGDAKIDLAYQYDKPALKEDRLGWHPSKPNGIGYSLDLHVSGKLPYGANIAINAYDLLGKMYWRDMPMTDYNFNYNAMGRPPYTLEGQLSKKDLTQSIPWRIETALEKPFSPTWSASLYSEFNDVSHLHQLAVTYHTQYKNTPLGVTGLIEPQTSAIGLKIKHKDFGISYLTDDLNTNRAKRAAINFFIRHDW